MFKLILFQEDPYDGCGNEKICIGCVRIQCVESGGCLQDKTCDMFLSFIPAKPSETFIAITIMRRGAGVSAYVAVGFSQDVFMVCINITFVAHV